MKKINFIYLSTFHTHGGIEKFNRCFLKSLSDNDIQLKAYSLYDFSSEIDTYYIAKKKVVTAKNNKLLTFLNILSKLIFSKSDISFWAHINLYPLYKIVRLFSRSKKNILLTHGIDVWEDVNSSKRKFLHHVQEIWAVSNYTKNKIVELYQIKPEKIKVFHNTIDPSFNYNLAFEKNKELQDQLRIVNKKVLLTVCRVSNQEGYKGYDRVIECLSHLPKTTVYLLVGKYDEDEKNRLLNLAKSLNVEDQFKLIGFVSDEMLLAYYSISDLFIMPSTDEGFGIVFIEAMACGLKVIAGNQDGSVDALKNGELGLLVNPVDVSDILKAINSYLYSNSNSEESFSKAERKRKVLESFGFETFKKNQKKLIDS